MDGGGPGSTRNIHDPEGLLRSALEKIVFFECRVSQLESELAAAKAASDRARGDAAGARRREVELEQALAAEEGQADLAGFIAELRAEIETLRAFKDSAVAAGFGAAAAAPERRAPERA